jgi:CheY-like chemotaxis protein
MSPATQVVVVADDDRVTRRVLSALLERHEVCALIRADSDLAATQPVIVMVTAAGQEADRARAVEAGVDDFVTKPFSPSQLSAKLQQLVPPS